MTTGRKLSELCGLALALLLNANMALGQPRPDAPLVAIFTGISEAAQAGNQHAFTDAMERLGYTEGVNIRYEFRYANGDAAQYDAMAREIAAMNPDVIVSSFAICSSPEVRALLAQFPVVVPAIPMDLQKACVADPRYPRNLTGILASNLTEEDRLRLAKELVPNATQVGYLLDVSGPDGGDAIRRAVGAAAAALDLTVLFGESTGPADAVQAFQSLVDRGAQVVVFPVAGSQFDARRSEIIGVAATAMMPTVYSDRQAVTEGGLIGLEADQLDIWVRAAALVQRILEGTAVTDIKIQAAPPFRLAVNPEVADRLDLTLPRSITDRAEVVPALPAR